jgi:peptide/nickel transport system permease protein
VSRWPARGLLRRAARHFPQLLANLILAFPVILLFYLLVTPEIVQTGIPSFMAVGLFLFPIVFLSVLLWSRFHTQRRKAVILVPP